MAIQDEATEGAASPPRSRRHRKATGVEETETEKAAPVELSSLHLDITSLPLSLIDENPENPRRVFRDIEGLSVNIGVHGVLQPLLVRPLEGKRSGRFEIVFGARRYRASKLAELEAVPCTVRAYTDAEALELAIVENSQRSDVHPLEEADGYKKLREVHGYTVEEIAAKVGKSHAHVYQRLKFCSLTKEAREAFFADKLTAATALLIARIPHEDLQKKALKELTTENYEGDLPGIREATEIVKDKFMLRLVDAKFDREDATLVKGALACSACPKRTGNQRALFADLEEKDDLCTDPKCFSTKQSADLEKRKAAAKEIGQKILSQKESTKLFPYVGARLPHNSQYVDLDDKHYAPNSSKGQTFKAIVEKAGSDVKPVLALDREGKLHELVPRAVVNKLLPKEKNAPGAPARDTKAAKRAAEALKKERERAKREKERRASKLVELVSGAEAAQPSDEGWRGLARALVRAALADARVEVCMRRGVAIPQGKRHEAEKLLIAHAGKLTGAQARGLVFELAARTSRSYSSSPDAGTKELLEALKTPAAKAKTKNGARS